MTAAERAVRTAAADELCRSVFLAALGDRPVTGVSLVAVGGYGRSELAPFSDLDVVLLHEPAVEVGALAQQVWYPLWDANVRLDHSVRALAEVTDAASHDVRVALGLLDARHLAGDTSLTLRLRADVLAHWRRQAQTNLPRLRDLVHERQSRVGELAHVSVPDLKEAAGGLRDATVLKALMATWLVDVPHVDLERSRLQLLDVRDVLQDATGRASDRVTPELWWPLALGLGLVPEEDLPRDGEDPDPAVRREAEQEAQRRLRVIGRRTTHLSRLTWSRVDQLLAPATPPTHRRVPRLERVAPGVAVSAGEVVLERGADPAADPLLLLRAAVAAAERRLMLAPPTAARLAGTAAPLPDPWPDDARDLLVRLLAAGPGLLPVWETLDETGAIDHLLPEWQRIRLLPHASSVHRFTVDRHVVETCVEASRLIRRVARPDLLMVAALLHDIGKGGRVDHSVAGEPIAAGVAARMGFGPADVATLAQLVRHHLLLAETATSRDLDDPATVRHVAERVGDPGTLDLLEVLSEADARATATKAWTSWRAGLVADLASLVRVQLSGGPDTGPDTVDGLEPVLPEHAREDPTYLRVDVTPNPEGARIRVIAHDRVGLMADVAGALALLRMSVRAARAWTVDAVAVSDWQVDDAEADASILTARLEAVVAGSVDPSVRVRPRPGALPPSLLVRHDASREATVLEVRTEDRPGVVYLACRALARLDLSVRSAHVSTVGPQALDVFYVQESGAGVLTDERAASAVHAVRRALEHAATLDA